MRLFYGLCAVTLVCVAVVGGYDLFQAEVSEPDPPERIVIILNGEPRSPLPHVIFEKPAGGVRIVYASMFGPGEPIMRIRDKWISLFEQEYSARLSEEATARLTADERSQFYARWRPRAAEIARNARRRLKDLPNWQPGSPPGGAVADERGQTPTKRHQGVSSLWSATAPPDLVRWLERQGVVLQTGEEPPTLGDIERAIGLLERLPPATMGSDPNEEISRGQPPFSPAAGLGSGSPGAGRPTPDATVLVRAHVRVTVERRWQGRWVLSTNRPRFLTGRDVPDIIVGSKMELYALAQDDYAVALDEPLPGGSVAPLDSPDTWGDPRQRWRDAFLPAMLAEGKYPFMEDEYALRSHDGRSRDRRTLTYLAPLWCNTVCIFYNALLFEKAGIAKPPRTWPEFMATCHRLKAAGIAPLTADQDVYSDYWQMWLICRALGPEAWVRTMTGAPTDKPVQERRADPPWTDERYQRVYEAIRELRDRGCFKEGFLGSTWPAAQRGFATGDAAMMICGSWLPQELGRYEDAQSEGRLTLRCFSFPQWPDGPAEDQTAAYAIVYGMMVCRQGRATSHAIELLKYLSAHDHVDLVAKNAMIGCVKAAAFPPALEGIREDFIAAQKVYSTDPTTFSRRFHATTLLPLYSRFFRKAKGEEGYLTPDEFLKTLADKTAAYLRNGGEEGYE